MRLELKNIGKLAEAAIEFNGITVIAGENDTGKSTVGKALYSIFNGYYDVENRIENERKTSIYNIFRSLDWDWSFDFYFKGMPRFIDDIYKYADNSITSQKLAAYIKKYLEEVSENIEDEDEILNISEKIIDVLKVSKEKVFQALLERALDTEFFGQVCNMYSNENSYIKLTIKEKTVTAELNNNKIVSIDNFFTLKTEAIYIDDPFVLDDLESFIYQKNRAVISHRKRLMKKLRSNGDQVNVLDAIITNNKLDDIYKKINSVCQGELHRDNRSWTYQIPGSSKKVDVNNISTGLKTFVIIKNLLQNGEIGEKSTLILDEPEIHLHPQWQLVFAEIIVLLQKAFDMTILINTHSPYFLEAVEVYSQKHGIAEKCKYYLAENLEALSIIKDVTNDTEQIYKKLAVPFQVLENERYSDD